MLNLKKDTYNLRRLAKGFTPTAFKRLLVEDDIFLEKSIGMPLQEEARSLQQSIVQQYKTLEKHYKCEYLYKNILLNKLLLGRHSLKTTTAFNEFKINHSKADFVLLNGRATVYEIKSEFDDLEKLEKQLLDYSLFATHVYVVTDAKLLDLVIERFAHFPIGVIELTKRNSLSVKVEASPWLNNLSHQAIMATLRKSEYLAICNKQFGYVPEVPNTRIFRECLSLFETLDVLLFQKLAVTKLKERKIQYPELLLSEKTPYELKHICYFLDLTHAEYGKLFKKLSMKAEPCISHT